jgi:hypothetical protein
MRVFERFLTTGCLDRIEIGTDQQAVAEILGRPTETGRNRRTEFWKYGALQIFLENCRVCFIGIYFRDGSLAFPARLCSGGWQPSPSTTLDEFQTLLQQLQVPYEISPQLTFGDQIGLKLSSDVTAIFGNRGSTCLDSLQRGEVKTGQNERRNGVGSRF